MGPGAAGAVEWVGCSPFRVSPKGREPQEFLNLGVGGCLLLGRRQELLKLQAALTDMGWGVGLGVLD